MCNTRNSKRITLHNRKFRIDGCMRDKIMAINTQIPTLACCCGHGRYPETIIVNVLGVIRELHSGVEIPRTRNFYKTDFDGYYYLPEVSKPLSPICLTKQKGD